MLREYEKPMVMIDPRVEGVDVPEDCYDSLPLGIGVGTHGSTPVRDLEASLEGFSATIEFHGLPYKIWIPWDSVFGMVGEDRSGPVWPDFIPEELIDKFPLEMTPADPIEETPSEPTEEAVRPFGVIDGGGEGDRTEKAQPALRIVH